MNTGEIRMRIRIGLALLAGYLAGRALVVLTSTDSTALFVGGFFLGFYLCRGAFWLNDRRARGH